MARPTALDVARFPPPWMRDHRQSVAPTTGPLSVTFPTTPLNARVYIALGADLTQLPSSWVWEDITAYVRFASGIDLTTGRQDQTSQVQTGSATLTLDNRDGRFNRRNANSPYYGKLTLNTPIWGTIDAGSGTYTRLAMFVNEWPARSSDRSGNDITVQIQCAGILRRLGQGSDPKSALRRTITGWSPTMYLPLEGSLYSGLPGVLNGTLVNGVVSSTATLSTTLSGTLGTVTGPYGSSPVLSFASGQILTWQAPSSSASTWAVEFIFQINGAFGIASPTIVQWTTSSAIGQPFVEVFGADISNGGLWIFTQAGTAPSNVKVDDGLWHHVRVTSSVAAGTITTIMYLDGVAVVTLTPTGSSVGYVSGGSVNPGGTTNISGVGHLAVTAPFSLAVTPASAYQAMKGYVGEQAHARAIRTCAEESIPLVCTSSVSPAMGPQPVADIVDVLRDAEDASAGGVLYEALWGLGFQTAGERENAPVLLALDYNQGHVASELTPADDDQRIRNRWTVTRQTPANALTQGGTSVLQAISGSMGSQAGGPGLYDDGKTVNVNVDLELLDQAGWRLHLGQVDVDRWGPIPLRFHGTPALIDPWCKLPYGARMTVANPPGMGAVDTIDAIIEGWTESWTELSWDAVPVTSPFQPYKVAQLDDIVLGRLDTAGCQLVSALGTGDTTLTAYTSVEPVWTTDATQVPFDINLAGERITFTNVSSRLKDTYNRTVSNGWGTADTGNAYSNQGGANSDYAVAPGGGTHSLGSVNVMRSTFTLADDLTNCSALASWTIPAVATGAFIATSAVLRGDFFAGVQYQFTLRFNADTTVTGAITRVTGAGSVDLVTTTIPGVYGANSKYWLRCAVFGTTLQMRAWQTAIAEPMGWQLVATDTAISHGLPGIRTILASGNTNTLPVVITTDSWEVYNPQTITVMRSVNTVVKSHVAGESMSLWTPIPLGL